jgi:hypothetical protein
MNGSSKVMNFRWERFKINTRKKLYDAKWRLFSAFGRHHPEDIKRCGRKKTAKNKY